ncbi:MAG: prepilin-type N-terminal cleavage/methylation domain-containing protein [Candidatus Pacebacteria bacterium]|nr:prepilin-type N-terminal cleavage/methylation domain-containing protein [Candidatus Paceibacterota bacterium]
MSSSKNRGFTLIELLVVISIISLLSSIVMTGVADAKIKALDAKRIQEKRSIDTAVQLYISDKGKAPDLQGTCAPGSGNSVQSCFAGGVTNPTGWAAFQLDIAKYMPKIPNDPCGLTSDCATKGLEYTYVAPHALEQYCVGCTSDTLAKTYAVQSMLQKSAQLSGISTLSTFYAIPIPSGGGGSGGGYGN